MHFSNLLHNILRKTALLIPILLMCSFCFHPKAIKQSDLFSEQKLFLSITKSKGASTKIFTERDLSNNYKGDFSYQNISTVTIYLNNKQFQLEEAIRNNTTTVEEIISFAQQDARNGYCSQLTYTHHGLTTFIYRYSDFELHFIYDVYELPSGKDHLVQSFSICLPGQGYERKTVYTVSNGIFEYLLDREDWGIKFEVVNANSVSLTLKCFQSNGQQIGELNTDTFFIYDSETFMPLTKMGSFYSTNTFSQNSIVSNSISHFTIDWSDIYGELKSGQYIMSLYIVDKYDKSTVHPLMKNFYDRQNYYIEFTIP